MRGRRILLGAAVLALALPVAPAAAQTEPARAAATIVDFGFEPAELTVPVETTVTWTNTGERPHTATDRGGTFDTDPIVPGSTGEATLTVPGTYNYFCRINPGRMNARIIVQPGPEPPTVQRVEALDPAREGQVLSFNPTQLTVGAGSAILFANVGGAPHSLTADDGSFDTGVVDPGAEQGRFAGGNVSITLETPGTFPFHCEIHPAAMTGTITVAGDAPAEAPPSPTATGPPAGIDIADFEFQPVEQSVQPGSEVTWTNGGRAAHTATFDDIDLDTAEIAPGEGATLTAPADPGSYSYFCAVHPARMRGVLVVIDEEIEDPTQQVTAPPAEAGRSPGAPGPADAETTIGGIAVYTLAMITVGIGAFLGGFGLSGFARGERE
jgi:plastocyanin